MAAIKLENYEHARAVFNTARWPAKGKPLGGCSYNGGYRLFADGDAFVIRAGKLPPVCRITPDNVLTFIASTSEIRANQTSYSHMLMKLLPVGTYRIATGRWSVGPDSYRDYVDEIQAMPVEQRTHWHSKLYKKHKDRRKAYPEYFQGIAFNMATKECLNSRPPLVATRNIDKEKRKVWLSDCRALRKALKVRHRLGVVEAICENTDIPIPHDLLLEQSDKIVLTMLRKRGDISTEDIQSMHYSMMRRTYWYVTGKAPSHRAEMLVSEVNNRLKSNSIEFRKQYGVFKSEA